MPESSAEALSNDKNCCYLADSQIFCVLQDGTRHSGVRVRDLLPQTCC